MAQLQTDEITLPANVHEKFVRKDSGTIVPPSSPIIMRRIIYVTGHTHTIGLALQQEYYTDAWKDVLVMSCHACIRLKLATTYIRTHALGCHLPDDNVIVFGRLRFQKLPNEGEDHMRRYRIKIVARPI